MYGSTLLNTKISALISIFSGLGFVTVLFFTPVKPSKNHQKRNQEHNEILPYQKKKEKKIITEATDKKEERFYSLSTSPDQKVEFNDSFWGSGFVNSTSEKNLNLTNDVRLRSLDSVQPDIFSYYKDSKISIDTLGNSRVVANQILEYRYQNKLADNQTLFQASNPRLKNVEMNYQINSAFSASFKSTQFDIFDDRLKQYPTTMGGVSFKGNKYISTGFIAGESTLNNPYRYGQNGIANASYMNRETEISFRDVDRANKNLFEWQANITPTKNILLQTAVYNSNRSLINETNASEGARVAMAISLKYFILNMKYNYLADNLMRTIVRPDAASVFNKDYAAFGFTIFLDKYKRYSIYVANNYYNIATANRPTESNSNIQGNNSFSASFRGKNSNYFNATFFLNFKNNTNKDLYYSNFGVFRLPVYSQLNLDYATSLGLELSF